LDVLRRAITRLYTEDRMSGDDMRDMAQRNQHRALAALPE
jgi:hypothetical protein